MWPWRTLVGHPGEWLNPHASEGHRILFGKAEAGALWGSKMGLSHPPIFCTPGLALGTLPSDVKADRPP